MLPASVITKHSFGEIRPACTLGARSVFRCSLTLRAPLHTIVRTRFIATHSSSALFIPAVAIGVGAAALPHDSVPLRASRAGREAQDDKEEGDTGKAREVPVRPPRPAAGTCPAGVARRGRISFENHAGGRLERRVETRGASEAVNPCARKCRTKGSEANVLLPSSARGAQPSALVNRPPPEPTRPSATA